jgi:hypothetical protein
MFRLRQKKDFEADASPPASPKDTRKLPASSCEELVDHAGLDHANMSVAQLRKKCTTVGIKPESWLTDRLIEQLRKHVAAGAGRQDNDNDSTATTVVPRKHVQSASASAGHNSALKHVVPELAHPYKVGSLGIGSSEKRRLDFGSSSTDKDTPAIARLRTTAGSGTAMSIAAQEYMGMLGSDPNGHRHAQSLSISASSNFSDMAGSSTALSLAANAYMGELGSDPG